MKMARRTSKRMSTKKRVKIERKVREHNRKAKRDRKNGHGKRKAKEIVVPRLAPFKDNMMKEIEILKKQKFAEKANRKKMEHVKRTECKKIDQTTDSLKAPENRQIHGFQKEVKSVIETSDVLLEQLILTAGKKLILVLNKSDLVPVEIRNAWVSRLRDEFPTVSYQANKPNSDDNERLMALLVGMTISGTNDNPASSSNRVSQTIGVLGLPNVGKSSLINALKCKGRLSKKMYSNDKKNKVCEVGSVPGLTRTLKHIKLDRFTTLIDSPGVTEMTLADSTRMILNGCIDPAKLDNLNEDAIQEILDRCTQESLMCRYRIADFNGIQEFLVAVAKRFGFLEAKGIPNKRAAALKVIRDWTNGALAQNFIQAPKPSSNLEPLQIVTIASDDSQAEPMDIVDSS